MIKRVLIETFAFEIYFKVLYQQKAFSIFLNNHLIVNFLALFQLLRF